MVNTTRIILFRKADGTVMAGNPDEQHQKERVIAVFKSEAHALWYCKQEFPDAEVRSE